MGMTPTPGTMTATPATGVDLDTLVEQMIKKGPKNVSCPPGLPQYDFEQIQNIIKGVLMGYGKLGISQVLNVPWQAGNNLDRISMMEYIKVRDYDRAFYCDSFGQSGI